MLRYRAGHVAAAVGGIHQCHGTVLYLANLIICVSSSKLSSEDIQQGNCLVRFRPIFSLPSTRTAPLNDNVPRPLGAPYRFLEPMSDHSRLVGTGLCTARLCLSPRYRKTQLSRISLRPGHTIHRCLCHSRVRKRSGEVHQTPQQRHLIRVLQCGLLIRHNTVHLLYTRKTRFTQ